MHVRTLLALVVAALVAGPAAAHAQAKKSSAKASAPATTSSTAGYSAKPTVDGWIGYESDDPLGGFQLRGDYVWPYKVLAPNLDLSFVGAVGLSRLSESVSTPAIPPLIPAMTVDTTGWMFKVIPTARFTYNFPQDRRFSVFGDAGLGLAYSSVSIDMGGGSSSDSSVGVTLRLGAGGFFRVDPKWQLGATIAFDPTSGDFGFDTWSFLAGAKFAL